jgi:hypothetical protein
VDFVRGVWDAPDGVADFVQRVDEFLGVKEPGIGKLSVCGGVWRGFRVFGARWDCGVLEEAALSACSGGLRVHGAEVGLYPCLQRASRFLPRRDPGFVLATLAGQVRGRAE